MSPDRQPVLCLEPRIAGPRHSGGFFYNDCLAAAAAARKWTGSRTLDADPAGFTIRAWDGGSLPQALVLLDSLWWYAFRRPLDVLAPVLAGRSWGIIMHGLPDEASGLLGDMAEASFVVVPSFWAAGQLENVRSSVVANGRIDVRVLYPGWDGLPGLVSGASGSAVAGGTAISDLESGAVYPGNKMDGMVRIASSSNWVPGKGLVEAACALGALSLDPACPPWLWQAAGTPDPELLKQATSCLGSKASSLQALGHLDPAALIRLLHGADIFLHPSMQETFCLSVFEAVLAGCRVVARSAGGVPEAIHLARLLRRQLGQPIAEVRLVPAHDPWTGETDQPGVFLEEALQSALEAALSSAAKSREASYSPIRMAGTSPVVEKEPTEGGNAMVQAMPTGSTGLLREFSWQGRLEKLLCGQSDGPLPAIPQQEQVEGV